MTIDEMKIRDERQFRALTGVSPEEFRVSRTFVRKCTPRKITY